MEPKCGQYVRLHPATDLFMMGCAYANVISVGNKWITIRPLFMTVKKRVPKSWWGDLLIDSDESFP